MTERGRYQGVLQIWQYNRPFYLLTLAAVPVGLLMSLWLPFWPRTILRIGIFAILLWVITSLAVSHYIYDRSSLYDFSWMPVRLGFNPQALANFHAGLDECSELLQAQFPAAELRVFDIFDAREMTEPSIARARQLSTASAAAIPVAFRSLPGDDGEFDAAFVIFAAHELRARENRDRFFGELVRVTRPGGAIILFEHLRDTANFLAFGPGFLHFFSRRDWLSCTQHVGLRCESEFAITPFIRAFVFRN